MTLLWRICSRLLGFGVIWLVPAWGASVRGNVELVDSKDATVQKHKDYSGVVVWLEPAVPVRPSGERVQMVQRGKRFIPHLLAIPVGSTVDFPNFDPIFHSAFSNFAGQPFDVGLYPPGTNRTVTFKREGVVRVFCNIHPTMSAVIIVLNTPYFAVSQKNGSFSIPQVPAGDYRLRLFHERASEKTLKAVERRIAIPTEGISVPTLVISESGYLQSSHKNKYGLDYPPVNTDRVYPGASK